MTINILSYRPLKRKLNYFNEISSEVEVILKAPEKPERIVMWTGDFKFHFVKWQERGAEFWVHMKIQHQE